jgi:large subunit ribosomal protein L25
MKTVSLSGSPRENVGKKDAKELRTKGHVPCVIYGGKEQIHFSMDERNFQKLVFTPEACYVEINIGDNKYLTILQDIQYHPVSDKILHADFLEIREGKPVKLDIPVRLEGTSPGILKGGRLSLKLRKVPLKAAPENMPQEILLNIGKLDIGDKIKASQITSDKYDVLLNENTVVVMILKARGADISAGDEEEGEGGAAEKGEGTEEATPAQE